MRHKKKSTIQWEPPIQIKKEFLTHYLYLGIDPGHAQMGVSCGGEIPELPPLSIPLTRLREWLQAYVEELDDPRPFINGGAITMPLLLGIEWFGNWGRMQRVKSAATSAIDCVKDYWTGPVIVCKVYPDFWRKKIFGTATLGAVMTYSGGATWKEQAIGLCADEYDLLGLSEDAAEAHLIRECAKVEFEQRLLRKGLI